MSDAAAGDFGAWLNEEFPPGETPAAGAGEQQQLTEPPAPVQPPRMVKPPTEPLPPLPAPPASPTPDRADREETGRSSVKITVNAKGDHQWEIKVYADDTASVAEAAAEAQRIDQQLVEKYGLPGSKR